MSTDDERDRTEGGSGPSSPKASKAAVIPVSTVKKRKDKKTSSNSTKKRRLNRIRKNILKAGLNDSGNSFKRSSKNRKPCHEKMQRKVETDCIALGVLQLEQDTISTIMNCADLMNPKDADEATAITKMCLYGNLKVPKATYAKVKDVTLNAKFLFTSMPFTESKEDCLAYALHRDTKYNLLRSIKEGDKQDDTAKGGMSDPSDVVETRVHADKMGFPFNNRAEEITDPPTKDELTSIIVGQRVRLQMVSKLGEIALREMQRYVDALKSCEERHEDDAEPFVGPGLSAKMKEMIAKRTDPKNVLPEWD